MPTVIQLRAETKPFERRSPLSPDGAKALLDAGYVVRVERSSDRIYKDAEYEAVGAELVPTGSWKDAPHDTIILGLKELPDVEAPLPHTHVTFHHIFKQTGHEIWLNRFKQGGGTLYDLEFLCHENGARVSAFGYSAGYAGAALALYNWAHQLLHPDTPQGPVPMFDNAQALIDYVKAALEPAIKANGQPPQIIIIGALGRCGRGATEFCRQVGQENILKWDLAETKKGGPFPEIAQSDIFVNCVFLGAAPVPPFVTFDSLNVPGRRLRVIADVSCDPNSPSNPVPLYSTWSDFENPTLATSKPLEQDPQVRIIAIDHLPTLIAREASDEYSAGLLPTLLTLDKRDTEGVWTRAEKVFKEKVAEIA
ncbi:alanine dehydrogenase [Stachybotrys elegans]|uniref:Saccharopine dehydrogenase [NAD(+), L-lysine-forming] n=1 Tax=Stachybotrys elegans TaxID=80388 RepID=A0A8K0SXZ0_9HYPO|nr:alanine dehydrogenase [Stachybotrys elegans]